MLTTFSSDTEYGDDLKHWMFQSCFIPDYFGLFSSIPKDNMLQDVPIHLLRCRGFTPSGGGGTDRHQSEVFLRCFVAGGMFEVIKGDPAAKLHIAGRVFL